MPRGREPFDEIFIPLRSAVAKTNKAANNAAAASCFMNISFKYARSTNNYGGGASSRAVCAACLQYSQADRTPVLTGAQ
jgi:hypothetical protein